tara:strand:- start:4844 stop:5770 length:927 start_codon:yes stop_codon:yes gene_type:complete
MKKFLLKSLLYFMICFTLVSVILLCFGGYADYFYVKFTTPKAKSMIIGGSRSMQGIQPRIINEKLKELNYDLPIFNYSFTIAQAPIGAPYTASILKKLDQTTTNGLFIISITPWMLSDNIEKDVDGKYREADDLPHNMVNVTMNPNYEYLAKNLSYFHFKGIFRQKSQMHKDGWLEESNLPKDTTTFINWKKKQKKMLLRFTNEYKVSQRRLKSLDILIKTLNKYGQVVLVRTPIDKDFLQIENTFFKNFDSTIKKVCKENNILYFNFNDGQNNFSYKTYDGHHIDKYGGVIFTTAVCDSILLYNNKN